MSDEEEMEALRRQKTQKNAEAAQAARAQQEQVRAALMMLLEPDAFSRLMLVKASNPGRFAQAAQAIAYLRQNGRMPGKMSDAQLRALLERFSASERHETSITFKRKGED